MRDSAEIILMEPDLVRASEGMSAMSDASYQAAVSNIAAANNLNSNSSQSPNKAMAQLPPQGRNALRAGVVGNWVDNIHMFLPLTALAPAIAALAGPNASVMTGAAVVIAMMIGRPIGSLIFGLISDRLGRTRATRLAIAGTAFCALVIAVVPSYEHIGVLAVTAVLLARFLGGIFIAGEYSAAIPLAMEWSQPARRGWMSGFILSMAPWAQASVAFASAGLLVWLGEQQYIAWGWRALFVAGMCFSLGMLAYYSRHVTDSPAFHRSQQTKTKISFRQLVAGRYAKMFWQAFMLMSGLWIMTDVVVLILPSRLVADIGLSSSQSSFVMGIASLAQAVFMAFAGWLSSKTGRRRLLVGWALLALATSPAIWLQITSGRHSFWAVAVLAASLQVVTVAAYGPIAAYLSERFPTQVRSTGYGTAYSFSLLLPALYPFYLEPLEKVVGHQGAPVSLLIAAGILVAAGAALGPRLARDDWDQDIDLLGQENS